MNELVGAFAAYLQAELRLSRATVSVYTLEARLLSRYCATTRPLAEFGGADLIQYLVHRQLEGASRKTTAKSLSALRAFFAFLLREGLVETNPAEDVETPRIPRHIPEVFSREEVERLLAAIDLNTPGGVRDRFLFELDLLLRPARVGGRGFDPGADLQDREVPAGAGQGRQGADRARSGSWPWSGWIRYLSQARPALARGRRLASLFVNHLGAPLTRKGMWKRFKGYALEAGVAGQDPHPAALLRHPSVEGRARTCAPCRCCWGTRTSARPRSTRTWRRASWRSTTGSTIRGAESREEVLGRWLRGAARHGGRRRRGSCCCRRAAPAGRISTWSS